MKDDENRELIEKAARDLVRIERKCFYGGAPERDRLRKMRELIDQVSKELDNDN